MDLPELDHTNEETLQASADHRASVALQVADSPMYYNGLPLKMTISIKSLFHMLQRLDGLSENGDVRAERDAVILAYLASQPSWKWSDSVEAENGRLYTPLRSRPNDWLAAIDEWADKTFTCDDITAGIVQGDDGVVEMTPSPLVKAINHLWALHHATRPVLDEDTGLEAMGNGEQTQLGKPTS